MSRAVGDAGERAAEAFLVSRGAEILARNFSAGGGEIDIVARLSGTILFVEVKSRRYPSAESPGAAITYEKQKRVCRAARWYLHAHGGVEQAARFDAILISAGEITWIKSAFDYAI